MSSEHSKKLHETRQAMPLDAAPELVVEPYAAAVQMEEVPLQNREEKHEVEGVHARVQAVARTIWLCALACYSKVPCRRPCRFLRARTILRERWMLHRKQVRPSGSRGTARIPPEDGSPPPYIYALAPPGHYSLCFCLSPVAEQEVIAAAEENMALEASSRLLAMFVNRGNSSWAAARAWCAPTLWEKAEQDKWAGVVQEDLCTPHRQGSIPRESSILGPRS